MNRDYSSGSEAREESASADDASKLAEVAEIEKDRLRLQLTAAVLVYVAFGAPLAAAVLGLAVRIFRLVSGL